MEASVERGGVRELLESDALDRGAVYLAWLGQAGFALRRDRTRLLIDPYLSDSLAEKYRGREFAHQRMMAAPIRPEEASRVDWVLCSHRHSDHMDPGSLPALTKQNPQCRFVVPRAEMEAAMRIGLPAERVVAIDAGESMQLAEHLRLSAIPSAHESLDVNDRGEYRYLGYILETAELTLYHSGDCVVYEGLPQTLSQHKVDVALLPVNGRDEFRRSRGVPGNMSLDEAVQLCRRAGIPWLIPHHFGMFDFNTIDARELAKAVAELPAGLQAIVPRTDCVIALGDKRKTAPPPCR
jgi:L-ascorbate metabolism protein UlaG (beta-lactamase superfamily)